MVEHTEISFRRLHVKDKLDSFLNGDPFPRRTLHVENNHHHPQELVAKLRRAFTQLESHGAITAAEQFMQGRKGAYAELEVEGPLDQERNMLIVRYGGETVQKSGPHVQVLTHANSTEIRRSYGVKLDIRGDGSFNTYYVEGSRPYGSDASEGARGWKLLEVEDEQILTPLQALQRASLLSTPYFEYGKTGRQKTGRKIRFTNGKSAVLVVS